MSSLVTIKQSDDAVAAAATALSAFCGNQMFVWNIPFLEAPKVYLGAKVSNIYSQ